ncbi:sigma-70 family RNA polymerase sigma factor [Cocleimonas flava]|jgi:RNA polymerase sigma-70 factor (ECF subfamily)|uniref:RNA polymerase sigma-70 factor (ECF subfamily) n=1 Tax=Cocleimonas flava TaxID=634765 RepID=A0A4R1FAM4_9GAMM|nr:MULTISPECIES: sigma-70 family RNA polymerase sigma factor [Cocleimonas]MEB8431287.1 sigma-70 family RNA polymerase sigma factor [Cocleimonas sp. KMM 6892]MEC4713941.1 sigma-70 family RNA polymerase sigma factor [Cocleimonas sp. KMM 6895]TCJ88968.1 RNA polymerase sigma-70 factor (ECF subfamily) [Cocleimonas flava]
MDAVVKNNKQTVEEKTKRDTELLKKISEGDRDAFTELYISYQPRLIKFCSRMLKYDVALAADIADEALIEVWRSAGSFSGLSQPSTWIHSIARFRMIGYLRKNKELLQDDDFEQLNIEDTDLLPEQEVIISERDQEIVDNLAKLSEKHREVIELVYYRELSIKDISVMLDISENTVKTRMFYARKHLKSLLSNTDLLDTSNEY